MANQKRIVGEKRDQPADAAHHEQWWDQILCGDAYERLQQLPGDLVDTIVTSPPYYRQRDYQTEQQIGQEATVEFYLERLVDIFRECRRVVKPTGSLWLVLGDKYLNGRQLGLPWRVALALQEEGWILRSDII